MNFFKFILLFLLFNHLVFAAVLVPCAFCNVLNYRESEPGLIPYKAFTFGEEVVVYLVKLIDLTFVKHKESNFVDGSIEANQVDFTIPVPESNFCLGPDGLYILDLYRTSDSILVIYVNSTDISTASYYGLIVDKSGKPIRFVIK